MKKYSFISLWVFLITAAAFTPFAAAGVVMGPGWEIAGVADFNGDGSKDILWRNQATWEMAVWYMHGNTLVAELDLRTAPDSTWDVVGVGDFNEDGRPEVLLTNKLTGDVRIWYLNEPVVTDDGILAGMEGPWKIVGVGDFNGDGSPDIVWRNSSTGETVVWYMKGNFHFGSDTLVTLPPPWNIIRIGDFDRDGSPDILLKNSATGEVVVWYMRGLVHLDPGAIVDRAPPLDIVGEGDLNGHASPYFIWRHIATFSGFCPHLATGLPFSVITPVHIFAPRRSRHFTLDFFIAHSLPDESRHVEAGMQTGQPGQVQSMPLMSLAGIPQSMGSVMPFYPA